jgi:hypothetical protein
MVTAWGGIFGVGLYIAHFRCHWLAAWKTLALFGLLGFGITSRAQDVLTPSEIPIVSQIIDSRAKQNSLKCDVRPWAPFLDFSFRYQTGLALTVSLGQFALGEEPVTYLRVTPQGGSPVILRAALELPSVLHDQSVTVEPEDLRRIHFTTSGAFNIGEGRYSVEFLLRNRQGRSCYKRWNVKTGKYSDKSVRVALSPRSVVPVAAESWDGRLDANGVRLSVLLDAAPIHRYAAQLYAWDRALLLQALASLLKQLPCQSVQLVAFNFEQQREVFRQEKFDSEGFARLDTALQHLELASLPYQALLSGNESKFLLRLAQEQTSAKDPSDAVVFLGPLGTVDENPVMQLREGGSPRFFYFEFHGVGTHFPDSIEHLTKELHGSVFHISSPSDLSSAIQKTVAQLRPSKTASVCHSVVRPHVQSAVAFQRSCAR